jgi:F-type H+-transporting ATPase subunit delta
MRDRALARRYAKALFGLGQERGDVSALLAELDQLVELTLGNDELRRILFTPIHPRAERRAVIRELVDRLELAGDVRAFAMLLVDQNRIAGLATIRDLLRELVEQAAGRLEARVTTARPLANEEVERLQDVLSRRVGAEVTLRLEEDPTLIGGVVARVGDLMIDGSVRTQLASLAQSLRGESA